MDDNVMLMLGRIEGKLDAVHETLSKHIVEDAKIEVRLRNMERWRAYMIGMAAAAGAGAGKVLAVFTGGH